MVVSVEVFGYDVILVLTSQCLKNALHFCSWVLCYWISFFFPWKVELNEIESRCEEYPLTRAFCHLISTLVESSFPSNLGAGLRPPGFDPYLQFLRDSVFLRFRTRAYRRAAEKVRFREQLLFPYSFIAAFSFIRDTQCYKFIFSFCKLVKFIVLYWHIHGLIGLCVSENKLRH